MKSLPPKAWQKSRSWSCQGVQRAERWAPCHQLEIWQVAQKLLLKLWVVDSVACWKHIFSLHWVEKILSIGNSCYWNDRFVLNSRLCLCIQNVFNCMFPRLSSITRRPGCHKKKARKPEEKRASQNS